MSKKEIAIEDMAEEILAILRNNMAKLREALEGEIEFSPQKLKATAELARALAGVTKEVRAINKENRGAMLNLGPAEKRRLLIDWFSKLPDDTQRSVIQELHGEYNRGKAQKTAS